VYKHFVDPFIELTAAAAVTDTLKVGTSVCLLTEHHPISLAKTVANLDCLSHGRFLRQGIKFFENGKPGIGFRL